MHSDSLFEDKHSKSLLTINFIDRDSFKKNINNYENLFSDILEIIDFSISKSTNTSILPNIIAELIKHKDTNEFKIKIRQLYDSYFKLIFKLFSINEIDCCKQLLVAAVVSNDFGVSVAAKFYLDLVEAYEKKISVDNAVLNKLSKVALSQISYSNFNNIFICIPNRLFYFMSPNTRKLFIHSLLCYRPRLEDLFFIKEIYRNLVPSYISRFIKLFSNSEISKKGVFISIMPGIFLKFMTFIFTVLFIFERPYILKAISNFNISLFNLFFSFIRSFNYIFLKTSNAEVFIYRAMGGVGDLVMLRVAIKLHLKLFTNKLTLCVPYHFFPIFSDIESLNLMDINVQKNYPKFLKKYNFSDCPAGHFEGAQYPKIRTNRIESFIYASNLFLPSTKDQYRLLKFNPSSFPISHINCIDFEGSSIDLNFLKIRGNRKVIFYQPHAADSYKSYLDKNLINIIDNDYIVVLVGVEKIFFESLHYKNTYLLNENLHGMISSVQLADVCVGVDSSLIHIARAWSKPVVAIFGPTDGEVLMNGDPNFRLIQPNSSYFCAPCWRNESIKCRWNKTFTSDCLSRLESNDVINAINNLTNYVKESNE